jgi:hypothetical protein
MRALLGLLFFLAGPFWETKPPEKWTDDEVDTVLHASPWVVKDGSPEILVYFATAAPIEAAEDQFRARSKKRLPGPDPDYVDYLRDHRQDSFVLAIDYTATTRFGTEEDQRRMDDESEMVIGKKVYKLVGHFPPTPADPVLRLVFPREVKTDDKTVSFQLFLPGMPFPEREIQFFVKDLMSRGKLEM